MPVLESPARSGRQMVGISESPVTCILRTHADHSSGIRSAPSSIQSMLKNATETGDIGDFSIHPAYIPCPISRTSPSPRNSSMADTPNDSRHRNLNRVPTGDGRHNSLQSYCGTTASSIISLYQGESQKSLRLRSGHHLGSEQKTFSMSQSSQMSWDMVDHRSYGSLRPHSPFAYPTRLKRPGYRPSSPAPADLTGMDMRIQLGPDRGATFRTTSPLSISSSMKKPPVYPSAVNRSMPSLHCPPSPFPGSQIRTIQGMPCRLQDSRSQLHHSNPSLPCRPQPENLHKTEEKALQLSILTPLYYDYTEAFEERKYYNSSNLSLVSLTDSLTTGLKSPKAQDEDKDGKMDPTLLRTPFENAPISNVSSKVPLVDCPSPVAAPANFQEQMSSWEGEQARIPIGSVESDMGQEKAIIARNTVGANGSQEPLAKISCEDTVGHHILSSSRPQTRDRIIKGSQHSIVGVLDAHTLGRHHKPSIENLHPQKPTLGSRNTPDYEPKFSDLEYYRIWAPWRFPEIEFGTPEKLTSSPNPIPPTIQAPVRERSVFTRNSNYRTLCTDEELTDEARTIQESGTKGNDNPALSAYEESYPQAGSQGREMEGYAVDDTRPQHIRVSSPELQHRKPVASTQNDMGDNIKFNNRNFQASTSLASSQLSLAPQQPVIQPLKTLEAELHPSSYVCRKVPASGYVSVETSNIRAKKSLPGAAETFSSESDDLIEEDVSATSTRSLGCTRLEEALRQSPKLMPGTYTSHNQQSFEMADPDLLCPIEKSPFTDKEVPQFQLRVTRASSSTNGTIVISRHSSSLTSSPLCSIAAPADLIQADTSRHGSDLSIDSSFSPRDANSTVQVHSSCGIETSMGSPVFCIGASSGLHVTDVQSFFSDDSSNAERKGNLRQRLSHFKVLPSRRNSTERKADHERSASVVSRLRVSRVNRGPPPRSTDMKDGQVSESNEEYRRRIQSLSRKIKTLLYRGEKKLRGFGAKLKRRTERRRSESPALYAGV